MTLLIGTIARSDSPSKSHVVMTADGRCTGFDGRTRTIQSNTHQKLFAIPNTAIAIAHHGENIIGGKPVKEFLADFTIQHPLICESSVDQIADSLKKYADEDARNTLWSIPASKVIGFWITGFVRNRSHPELVEICWTKDVSAGTITLERKVIGILFSFSVAMPRSLSVSTTRSPSTACMTGNPSHTKAATTPSNSTPSSMGWPNRLKTRTKSNCSAVRNTNL